MNASKTPTLLEMLDQLSSKHHVEALVSFECLSGARSHVISGCADLGCCFRVVRV